LLTVSGEKKKKEKVEKKDYYRYECFEGSFSRSFRLPEGTVIDKAKAKFDKGILEIKIPLKKTPEKEEKKIKID